MVNTERPNMAELEENSLMSPPRPTRILEAIGPRALYIPTTLLEQQSSRSQHQSDIADAITCSSSSSHLELPGIRQISEIFTPVPPDTMAGGDQGATEMCCVPSEMVDHALDSLPGVVSDVVDKHRNQSDQINHQTETLTSIQDQIIEEKRKLEDLNGINRSAERKMFLAQEKNIEKEKLCSQIKKDIERSIKENAILKSNIQELEISETLDIEKLTEYQEKMKTYRSLVNCARKESNDLPQLRNEIKLLDQKKQALQKEFQEDGHEKKETRDTKEACETNATEEDLQKTLDNIIQQITNETQMQTQVSQQNNVTQKRNKAQLLRLRSQVSEAQSRRRYWQDQAQHLTQNINNIKSLLKESQ